MRAKNEVESTVSTDNDEEMVADESEQLTAETAPKVIDGKELNQSATISSDEPESKTDETPSKFSEPRSGESRL